MKPLHFMGSSLDDLRNFPDEARRAAGFELRAIQSGLEPSDWRPMPGIGPGVNEIRIWSVSITLRHWPEEFIVAILRSLPVWVD
jgi:phage-related protein